MSEMQSTEEDLAAFARVAYRSVGAGNITERQALAYLHRRKRTKAQVLAAATSSKTMKEAAVKLGVTRARFAVLLSDWLIEWHQVRLPR